MHFETRLEITILHSWKNESEMAQIPYIFNQLHNFLAKDHFDRLVRKYNGNAYVINYTCWNHLLVMIWSQLTSRRSLRDIETSIRAHSDKAYRLGFGNSISRNNIAYANSKRNVAIYREFAQEMMKRASKTTIKDKTLREIADVFGVSGFFAIDSSRISLDLNKFNWSVPQEETGGIKLHTLYDLLRNVPKICLITGHEERDQTFMESYPFERNCFYVFDKMYFKTRGFAAINFQSAYFVTRMKRNVVFETIDRRSVNGKRVLGDDIILFISRWAKMGYPYKLRRIQFYSVEKNEVLDFVTNNFDIDAENIALIYRYRWQIELFFKWIKQHLRVTSFYGTSANAVMIQIYVAFTAFCMLAMAASSLNYQGSLYEFANIMSVSLTEKVYLRDLLDRYSNNIDKVSADSCQLSLFEF